MWDKAASRTYTRSKVSFFNSSNIGIIIFFAGKGNTTNEKCVHRKIDLYIKFAHSSELSAK